MGVLSNVVIPGTAGKSHEPEPEHVKRCDKRPTGNCEVEDAMRGVQPREKECLSEYGVL